MIKINLLPRKVTRKKITVIRHLALGSVLLLVMVAAMGYFWVIQNGKIATLKTQVTEAEQEKDKLKNANQEKQQHEKNIEDLKHRIDVISQIEKGRTLPLRIMDTLTGILTESMPIWLTNLNYTGTSLLIEGFSFTNGDISRFLKELDQSPYLANVSLVISQKQAVQGKEIYRFNITADMETAPAQGG